MSTYQATAERDGKYWFVQVEGPNFSHATQARNLREIESMAQDLVVTVLDIDIADFEVNVEIHLPEDVQQHLVNSAQARDEAKAANARAAAESRAAARSLAATGMSVRDIGQALGISYQRAHQLISEPA